MRTKRILCITLFGLFGPLYLLGAHFVANWIMPGDGMQRFGEDEANRQLKVIAFVGIPLFILLWGWIGNVIAQVWRKGLGMIFGVVFATALAFIGARVIAHTIDTSALDVQVAFVVVWAGLAALFCWLISRALRQSTSPREQRSA